VLAFGAVYDWALLVLGAIAVVASASMIPALRRVDLSALAMVTLLAALVGVQILPLPSWLIHPVAHRTLYSALMEGSRTWESVSVGPDQTSRALACLLVLALCGTSLIAWLRIQPRATIPLARNIAVIATVVAIEALVQRGLFNGKIYWFWESEWRASHNYFGPFVDRDHFAGWMILAGSIAAGWLLAQISVAASNVKRGWRGRMLWWSSSEASAILMTTAGLLTISVSLVWTMSRSGIAGGCVALLVITAVAAREMRGARRLLGPAILVVVLLAAVLAKGADTLAAWYGTTDTLRWRFALWRDSLPMLKDFWLFGSGLNTYGLLTWVYPVTNPIPHAYEAHNDYLQLAIEGGLLLCVPALVALVAAIHTIRDRLVAEPAEPARWIRVGAIAGICGITIQELTDFSLQIPGIALLFVVLLAIALHDSSSAWRNPTRV
jgi:O-antigen ligase